MRTTLAVLGAHHSGADALARALVLCGGLRPAREQGADPVWDRLLQLAGAEWWQVSKYLFDGTSVEALQQDGALEDLTGRLDRDGIWILEDPRLCLLFPALRPYLPAPVCIHIYRSPIAVARSLRAAEGLAVAEGLALWQAYNTAALRATAGLPRVLVSYEALLADPEGCIDGLLKELARLGAAGLARPRLRALEDACGPASSEDDQGEGVEQFLTERQRSLWHRLRSGEALLVASQPALDCAVVETLRDLEARKRSEERLVVELVRQRAQLLSTQQELDAKTAQILKLRSDAKEKASDVSILSGRIELMYAQIAELHASRSWRITAPLRSASRLYGGVAGAVRRMPATAASLAGRTRTLIGRLGSETLRRRRVEDGAGECRDVLEGKDTFVLYRIIGNDLHPRHKRGQSLENLRFILEHEPPLPGCAKRFVLNRLLDPAQENEIIALLEQRGYEYLRIPFLAADYARIGFDTEILPDPGFLVDNRIDALDDEERGRLFAALYRLKNNYVMNNNGARNVALQDGRGRAKWVLPWDGNCFLTAGAWEAIRADVARRPANRYFTVPMARMLDNAPLLVDGPFPEPVEEPQIIFRSDAPEQFNPAFCYGRRPKVELLWRLGVRGPWDKYTDDPWDQERRPTLPPADTAYVGTAGWVARLFSGMGTLEADNDHAALHRGYARSGAIMATLQNLDASLAAMDGERLVSIRTQALRRETEEQRGGGPLSELVETLLQSACGVEARWSRSVPEGLSSVLGDSVQLALAYSFSGDERYARIGGHVIGRLFTSSATGVAELDDAVSPGGMYYFLDAVRIFLCAGTIGGQAEPAIRGWLRRRLAWLLTSPQSMRERAMLDHRGTAYDLEVAAIATFLEDHEEVYATLVRAQARISHHFAADWTRSHGPEGLSMHHCCLNLQTWIHLAELASCWGVDLWRHTTQGSSALERGARWMLSQVGEDRSTGQTAHFDADRLQPVRFALGEVFEDLPAREHSGPSLYAAKPVFDESTGIRPFWNLGSYGLAPE